VETLEHVAARGLAPTRTLTVLASIAGAVTLLLGALGIYGVVSYAVSRRTREVGIRMSLGASATDVVAMAVRGGMRLVLLGGVIGVGLAAAVTWSISRYLYGIGATDVATFVIIPLLLGGVALAAAFVPALRASAVDPARALRAE